MARRLTTEAVVDELELDDDFDEPIMEGSDDEFDDIEDVYLEDVEEGNDGDSDGLLHPNPLPLMCEVQARVLSLLGPLLSHLSPSLLSVHQWVLRSTFQSHQSTPLNSCLPVIFWMTS